MLSTSTRWALLGVLVIAFVGWAPAAPREPMVLDMDALVADYPDNVRMLLENDHVWVYEISLEPGDRLAGHRTGDFFVYALTDANLLLIPNYEPEIIRMMAGQAQWHPFEPHAVINRGTSTARYLVVARRSSVIPPKPVEHGCPLEEVAAPGTAKTLLNNRDGRVTEVTLPAGEAQPAHCGLSRVVYSLNSYEIRMGDKESAFGAGMAHFHEADNHFVENIGQTTAHYVVFEMKR